MFTLSVIVPVYNEEKTVLIVLKKLASLKYRKQIIAVNDGSYDNTEKELEKARKLFSKRELVIIKHRLNLGKGAALAAGIKKARGDVVVFQDADLEYDPGQISQLIDPILKNKAEAVYGSRFLQLNNPGSLHYLFNRLITFFVNFVYGANLTDVETGHKAFSKKVYSDLKLREKDFSVEIEITVKLIKKKIAVKEIPVRFEKRGYQEGKKIFWPDGFIALWKVVKYAFHD